MSFRKRERFDRSDVPVASPLRSIVSLVVLVAVGIGMVVLVSTLWHRVAQLGGLRDAELRSAIRSRGAPSGPPEGYVASDHDFTSVLVLLEADDATLSAAQILTIDETDNTAVLADLPLNAKLTAEGATTMLSDLYLDREVGVCIGSIAAASNVRPNHVIIAPAGFWNDFERLHGSELLVVMGPGADVLEGMRSDLSSHGLLGLVDQVAGLVGADSQATTGLAAVRHIEAPAIPEVLPDGREASVIDQTQLGVQLGLVVSAESAAQETAPAEGPAGEGDGQA